jgi:hypothetical protein
MQVEVMRRNAPAGHMPNPAEFVRTEERLHVEAVAARQLVRRLDPVHVTPADLSAQPAAPAGQFRRGPSLEISVPRA